MAKMVSLGKGSYVNADEIVIVQTARPYVNSRSLTALKSKENTKDLSAGNKTRSVIFLNNGTAILSYLSPETLASRIASSQDS